MKKFEKIGRQKSRKNVEKRRKRVIILTTN